MFMLGIPGFLYLWKLHVDWKDRRVVAQTEEIPWDQSRARQAYSWLQYHASALIKQQMPVDTVSCKIMLLSWL